jgi:hypothetical protein
MIEQPSHPIDTKPHIYNKRGHSKKESLASREQSTHQHNQNIIPLKTIITQLCKAKLSSYRSSLSKQPHDSLPISAKAARHTQDMEPPGGSLYT